MADFSALKTSIQNYIKQNGNEEITGNLLQQILLSMVSTLGDSAINDLVTALNAEIANRGNADTTLQGNIDNEATARGNADTELDGRITTLQGVVNGVIANVENGYVYAGIATPSSTPASGKVFYLALTAGTYTNFGSIVVPQGINILKYNGSAWSLDSFLGLDDAPTQGSSNLVKSGGVLDSIIKDGSAFDLSAYNNGTTYADLSAALTALNALPAAYKKGGMSMKYVQSSDNKYVQFRLMTNSFSTTVTDWQGVDDEPTAGSDNLVKSGGINELLSQFKKISVKNNFKDVNNFWGCNIYQGKTYRCILTLPNQVSSEIVIYTTNNGGAALIQYKHLVDGGGPKVIWDFKAIEDASQIGLVLASYSEVGISTKMEVFERVANNDALNNCVGDNFQIITSIENTTEFSTKYDFPIETGKRYKITLLLTGVTNSEVSLGTVDNNIEAKDYCQWSNGGLQYYEYEFFATQDATKFFITIADANIRDGSVINIYKSELVQTQINEIKHTLNDITADKSFESLITATKGFCSYEPSTGYAIRLIVGHKYRIKVNLTGDTSELSIGTTDDFINTKEYTRFTNVGSGYHVWEFVPSVSAKYMYVYLADYITIAADSSIEIYEVFNDNIDKIDTLFKYGNYINISNKKVLFLGHSLFGQDFTRPDWQSALLTGADELCKQFNGYRGNVFLNYAFGGSDWMDSDVRGSVMQRYKQCTEIDNAVAADELDAIIICQGENHSNEIAIGYDDAVNLATSQNPQSIDPVNGYIVDTLKYISQHSPQARIYLVKAFCLDTVNWWSQTDHIEYRNALMAYSDVIGLNFIDCMRNTSIHRFLEADANTRYYTVDGLHPYTIAGKKRFMSAIMKEVFSDMWYDDCWYSAIISRRR